jgi:Flp pilus assembly protein TadB
MIPAVLVGTLVVLVAWGWSPMLRRPSQDEPGANEPPSADDEGRPRITPGRARRDRTVDPAELAAWCDALARAVRGGTTVRGAVTQVEPPHSIAEQHRHVVLALERGAPLATALDVPQPVPTHLDLVLVVLRSLALHGGPSGEPLDRAAAALRQRAAIIGERRSQSAQAQLSAVVMTLLPGVLLAVLLLTSGGVRAAVVSAAGATVVALGAAANLVGWWWMRRLIRGSDAW